MAVLSHKTIIASASGLDRLPAGTILMTRRGARVRAGDGWWDEAVSRTGTTQSAQAMLADNPHGVAWVWHPVEDQDTMLTLQGRER